MQWIVDKIPDQSFLNTAGYRFIIPQLYKKYPNHDMNLNISLSSPPIIKISEHDIGAIIYADLIIDVLDEDGVIPVACISLVSLSMGNYLVILYDNLIHNLFYACYIFVSLPCEFFHMVLFVVCLMYSNIHV